MQAPASEYRAPPTPVPDRAVLTVLYSTLPFAELAGGQDLRTGPLGIIGLPLPIISRYVDSTFKSLPPCTTPLGLNKILSYTDRANHQTRHQHGTQPCPSSLWCGNRKGSKPILASGRKPLGFYREPISRALIDLDSGPQQWEAYLMHLRFQTTPRT